VPVHLTHVSRHHSIQQHRHGRLHLRRARPPRRQRRLLPRLRARGLRRVCHVRVLRLLLLLRGKNIVKIVKIDGCESSALELQ